MEMNDVVAWVAIFAMLCVAAPFVVAAVLMICMSQFRLQVRVAVRPWLIIAAVAAMGVLYGVMR